VTNKAFIMPIGYLVRAVLEIVRVAYSYDYDNLLVYNSKTECKNQFCLKKHKSKRDTK
jgi:hypothetical protein